MRVLIAAGGSSFSISVVDSELKCLLDRKSTRLNSSHT